MIRKIEDECERKLLYDISSCSGTERRNEMLLKAAFV